MDLSANLNQSSQCSLSVDMVHSHSFAKAELMRIEFESGGSIDANTWAVLGR
jgi:hypothetical protein